MGGLHAWCLAAARPELVTALVVEDMAPDFRGRTTGPWEPWLHALPVEFASAQEVFDEFGAVAGQYFLEAFDRTDDGLAAARATRALDRDRRGVGHPGLLDASGMRCGRRRF